MSKKATKIHLEIQTSSKSPVGVLRSSYRDSNGKSQHKQYGRIKGKTLNELKLLRLAFQGKVIDINSKNAFKILESKEYGASASILGIINDIGLDKDIYSKTQKQWVKDIMAMIAGRIIYQGSKLSLCNQYENSSLWQQAGHNKRPNVKDIIQSFR